jgi:hypothetical protein
MCRCVEMTAHTISDLKQSSRFRIFRLFGTPNEISWPGVSQLPDWSPVFPQWEARVLEIIVPGLEPLGIDLVKKIM